MEQIDKIIKGWPRWRKRISAVLACIIIFVTTYLMVLPAISLDRAGAEEDEAITLESGTSEQDEDWGEDWEGDWDSSWFEDEGESGAEGPAREPDRPFALTQEEENYTVTAFYGEDAELPGDVSISAEEIEEGTDEYKDYYERALEAVRTEKGGEALISYARFFDISFLSKGEAIEPAAPVSIVIDYEKALYGEMPGEVSAEAYAEDAESMEAFPEEDADINEGSISDSIAETGDISVVHFDAADTEEQVPVLVEAQAEEKDALTDSVSFESDSFSVYGIIGTTLEKIVLASDGHNYRITVTCGTDSGIPVNADLAVEEILPPDQDDADIFSAYDAYLSKAENILGWEAGSASYARLFEIKITDKDHPEVQYQPAEGMTVNVGIELADKDSSEEAAASTQVVHFADDAETGEVVENTTDGQLVFFEASGFSIYAIVDSTKRLQYNFYDRTSLLASEYIRKQDNVLQELYDYGVEPEYGQTFIGWAYSADETDPSKIYTIEQINQQAADIYDSAEEELTVINLYAIYEEAWYLRYMDQDSEGNATVLNVVRVRKDAADKDVTISYTFTPEEGVVFEGWMDADTGQTYHQGNTITLDHHADLYVKLQGRNWLVFDSNAGGPGSGATYTPPQLLIGSEAATEKPNDPVRRGYTFTGWNTKADGTGTWWYRTDGSVNRFGSSLSSDTTLYAQWDANDTDYYVVFWKQKAADAAGLADGAKQYDYVSSEHRRAKTGETVTITAADMQKGGTAASEYGYYFTYNGNNSDAAATVDANGTTVLNVYYDRREITYNFNSSSYFTVPSYTGVVDGETVVLTPDGNGGYTYQKEGETVNTYGWRYTDRNNRTYNLPSSYINGIFYSVRGTNGNPNSGTASAYTQDNLPPDNDTTQYYCYDTYDRRFYAIEKYITGSTASYTTEPYTGEVTISSMQTRSVSYRGLFGSNFENWPDPGTNRVWTSTYNGRTVSLPLALTLFDPQAALDPSAAQTTVDFTASNYSTGNTMTIYVQDANGEWGYSDDYVLTTANLGSNGRWYPTETFEGFTVHSYQIARNLNPNGSWTPVTSSGSFSYNNSNVFLRYSRNQHSIHFISQGDHVTGRTEQIVDDVYYDSDLSKYAEGGSDYYVPTNGREGYYFAGWYSDPDCQIPFDFNIKMPDHNITVYAKWDTYRVRVVLVPTPNNEHNDEVEFANNQSLSFRLDYNEQVSNANINSSVAKRPGYKLIGWYYSPDFDPNSEIHFPVLINKDNPGIDMNYQSGEDWDRYGDNDGSHDNVRGILKMYAKWELDVDENSVYVEYDVDDVYRTYDTAGILQTTIPVDDNKYALTNNHVTFQVAEAPTQYTSGFEFSKWVLLNPDGSESDILYYPGDTASEIPDSFICEETITDDLGNTAVIKKIRLKAKFNIETEKVTTVTFDGNGGVTNDSARQERVTEAYPINKDFTMKEEDSFVREGYTLIGWAFERDDGSRITAEDYKSAVTTMTSDQLIQAGVYQLGQKVAADNLPISDENNWDPLENTVYAVWEPHRYTVTITKMVDGETASDKDFTFTASAPGFIFEQGDAGYALKESAEGADVSFDLANAESVTIREVPYGTKLTFRETPCAGYIVESVDAEQISDPDGIPLENRIDLAGEDGKQYEVRGNIAITYTNKKGLVPVVLRKVGYTNTDPQEQTYPLVGAKFKIHEGSISGDCVTSEVGGEEVSEFTSAGADAVFFSGELKIGVRYYLEETEVPDGYNAPAGNYYFTITEDGIILNCDVPTGQSSYDSWIESQTTGGVTRYTISIRNVAGVSLPSTGGPGRGAFYLPGILLTGLALAGTVMKKKKTA